GAWEEILEECWAHGARLMGADPSRFEEGSLEAAEVVRSGTLGEPRLFSSVFTREAGPADEAGREVPPAAAAAGSAFAMSTACISAARSLFEEEPVEVSASALAGPPEPGADPELFSAVLRFAGGRLASFTCGFGSANVAEYRVVGTGGDLRVERAYGAGADLCHHLTVGGCTQTRRFRRRGQVAPELVYFSDCILYAREPDPDGLEALTDVGVVEAIRRSLAVGRAVGLGPAEAGRQGAFGPAGGHVAVPGPGRAPGWAAAAVPAYGAAR
ncbi:MAG TPA: Gfo/Idh/MocA family oxidoreductase, partial [Gemmataceae bacterium]